MLGEGAESTEGSLETTGQVRGYSQNPDVRSWCSRCGRVRGQVLGIFSVVGETAAKTKWEDSDLRRRQLSLSGMGRY